MTSIVGLVQGGKVYMAGDSSLTFEAEQWSMREPKVFHCGEYLVGFTGDAASLQVLHYRLELPGLPEDLQTDESGDPLMRHLVTKVKPALFSCLRNADCLVKKENREEINGNVLIGVAGRLFHVESAGHFMEERAGYIGMGAGSEYALGYMFATEGQGPHERLFGALEVGARFSAYVRPPFYIEILPRTNGLLSMGRGAGAI